MYAFTEFLSQLTLCLNTISLVRHGDVRFMFLGYFSVDGTVVFIKLDEILWSSKHPFVQFQNLQQSARMRSMNILYIVFFSIKVQVQAYIKINKGMI